MTQQEPYLIQSSIKEKPIFFSFYSISNHEDLPLTDEKEVTSVYIEKGVSGVRKKQNQWTESGGAGRSNKKGKERVGPANSRR